MVQWTTKNIPNQQGRLAVVTGTGGLGYEDALGLARAGAEVIIAGRNLAKGAEAVNKIRAEIPNAKVRFEVLDLAALCDDREFPTQQYACIDGWMLVHGQLRAGGDGDLDHHKFGRAPWVFRQGRAVPAFA